MGEKKTPIEVLVAHRLDLEKALGTPHGPSIDALTIAAALLMVYESVEAGIDELSALSDALEEREQTRPTYPQHGSTFSAHDADKDEDEDESDDDGDQAAPILEGAENPVSVLQEWCVRTRRSNPAYTIRSSGPAHAKTFKASVIVGGLGPRTGEGQGATKQEARAEAAKQYILGFTQGHAP